MIGFVLVTHTHIGHQMVLAIEQILKEEEDHADELNDLFEG